jgi:glycosyltransferase involved in cell wall biosynthesis
VVLCGGPPRAPAGAPPRIVYLGGFLPLHGALTIVDALALLEKRGVRFHAVLAGRGIEWEACRRQAGLLGLRQVEFPGTIPYAEAPAFYADADVVLGAFGAGEKAGRVVPHKVWQGLAAGRAVVTGDGEGLREWFTPGTHIAVAARGEAEAIAAVIARVLADSDWRAALATAGRARAFETGTPERVAAELVPVLEEALR